jgi:hypothetical protein
MISFAKDSLWHPYVLLLQELVVNHGMVLCCCHSVHRSIVAFLSSSRDLERTSELSLVLKSALPSTYGPSFQKVSSNFTCPSSSSKSTIQPCNVFLQNLFRTVLTVSFYRKRLYKYLARLPSSFFPTHWTLLLCSKVSGNRLMSLYFLQKSQHQVT